MLGVLSNKYVDDVNVLVLVSKCEDLLEVDSPYCGSNKHLLRHHLLHLAK